MTKARGKAFQHRVERRRKAREFVVRFALIEAFVEIVVAPGGSVLRHPRYGQERLAEDPVGQECDRSEECDGENDRADECNRRRLLVRVEGHTCDDGTDAFAVVDGWECIEANGFLDAITPFRSSGEQGRGLRPASRNERLLDDRVACEHPESAANRASFLQPFGCDQLAVREPERRELGLCLSPCERFGARGEPLFEDDVEGGDADDQSERECSDDRQKQPGSYPETDVAGHSRE